MSSILTFSFLFAAGAGASDNIVVVWPQYFDAKSSRVGGRRVPKKMAVKSPSINELLEAARSAGYKVYIEPDKAYPMYWWNKTGRLIVDKTKPKTAILKDIAKALKAVRSENSQDEKQ